MTSKDPKAVDLERTGADVNENEDETPESDEVQPRAVGAEDFSELEFDLTRKERRVKIKDKDGVVTEYILRELTGPGRDKYINGLSRRMKTIKGGGTIISDSEGLQADLISRSLFDKSGQMIPSVIIQKWPAGVLSKLFKAAQRLSGLGDDAEEDAGNG